MGIITGTVQQGFEELTAQVLLEKLDIKTEDEGMKQVLELLKECTVAEVLAYAQALQNAVQVHRYRKTKDWKLKDMNIELL